MSSITACATPGVAPVQTVEVKVPTPVRCTPSIGPRPAWADNKTAARGAPDLAAWMKLILEAREERDSWIGELEAAVKGCAG